MKISNNLRLFDRVVQMLTRLRRILPSSQVLIGMVKRLSGSPVNHPLAVKCVPLGSPTRPPETSEVIAHFARP